MKCHQCGARGKPRGMWYSPRTRRPFVFFVCLNRACLFEYTNFDGKTAKGRPLWMVPLGDVK